MGRDPQSLRQITDQLATTLAAGRVTHHGRRTGSLFDDPQQDFDKGRFAGSVGTQQTKDLALVNRQIQAFKRMELLSKNQSFTVNLVKATGFDCRCAIMGQCRYCRIGCHGSHSVRVSCSNRFARTQVIVIQNPVVLPAA